MNDTTDPPAVTKKDWIAFVDGCTNREKEALLDYLMGYSPEGFVVAMDGVERERAIVAKLKGGGA